MITALVLMCTMDMTDCYTVTAQVLVTDSFACHVSIEDLVNDKEFEKKYVLVQGKQYLPVDYACLDWSKRYHS